MHDFAKILLYCTSGGSYKFSDQKVGDNELKLCKIVEARDLIKKILNDRKVGLQHVLGHHFFWSTLERISFVVDFSNHIDQVGVKAAISRGIAKKIKHNKVFENRWDSNYLPDKLRLIGDGRTMWECFKKLISVSAIGGIEEMQNLKGCLTPEDLDFRIAVHYGIPSQHQSLPLNVDTTRFGLYRDRAPLQACAGSVRK
ncbi:hypothetical protein Tco_0606124 [Tanacetum coccineum]